MAANIDTDVDAHIEREPRIGTLYHRDQKLRIKANSNTHPLPKHPFAIGTVVYIKMAMLGREGFFMMSDKPDSDPVGEQQAIVNIRDTKPYMHKDSIVIVTSPDDLKLYAEGKGLTYLPGIPTLLDKALPNVPHEDIWFDFDNAPTKAINVIGLGERFCNDYVKNPQLYAISQ